MSMEEVDSPVPGAEYDAGDEVLGVNNGTNVEFDVEYVHPRSGGVLSVFAANKVEAAAILKDHIQTRYGSPDDLEILSVEPG